MGGWRAGTSMVLAVELTMFYEAAGRGNVE
jgi:hypothetical protein